MKFNPESENTVFNVDGKLRVALKGEIFLKSEVQQFKNNHKRCAKVNALYEVLLFTSIVFF